MKSRLSCVTVVISLLIIVLLSINVNALRGSTSPVDDEKPSSIRSRGSSRFSPSPTAEDDSSFSTSTSGAIIRRADSPLRRSSRLGSSLESNTKATLVSRKLAGRSHSAVSDPVESITPEDSVLGEGIQGKNTPRRNAQSLKDEVTTRNSGDRRHIPERRTRVRTVKSFSEPGVGAPKESSSQVVEGRISHSRTEDSRDDKILAQTGPSVFSGNVEYSRSRTGRKIQNPTLSNENENSRPVSRRWESRLPNSNARNNARNFDTTAVPQLLDITSVGTESARLEIPLSIPQSENIEVTTIVSDNLGATSEPSMTRGRGRSRQSWTSDQQSIRPPSESSTVDAVRRNSRRGGSRFTKIETESSTAGKTRSSSNQGVESRSKNSESKSQASESGIEAPEVIHRSRGGRGRGRKTDEVSKIDEDSLNFRSRGREPERQGRVGGTRSQNPGRSANRDEQRSSSRFGGRSSDLSNSPSKIEAPLTTTTTTTAAPLLGIEPVVPEILPKIVESEPTVLPEIETVTTATTPVADTFAKTESTTESFEVKSEVRNSRGKSRGSIETRRSQGENDFSDRRSASRQRKASTTEAGISNRREFRGRGRSPTTTTAATESKESHVPNQRRRLIGSTPREEFNVAKTAPSLSASPEEAIVGSSENPLSNIPGDDSTVQKSAKIDESEFGGSTTSTIPSSDSIPRRRGMKRLNIRPKDELEELSTASSIKSHETLNENGRRRGGRGGAKSIRKSEISGDRKPANEVSEEDNYPADFKAKLALLKNSDSKVPAAIKSTSRTATPNFRKPSPILFSTNGRSRLEKAKKLNNPAASTEDNELVVEQTSVSPSTTQVPDSLPPRKPLFGKRPKPAPSTEPKILEPEESTTRRASNARTSLGNRPSFGKNRRIERPEVVPRVSIENSQTLQTENATQRINENFKTRAIKQRPNFAKRRSAPTTDNTIEIDATVTRSTTPLATTFKPLRSNENSVSKYVRASRISQSSGKATNQLEKSTKVELHPSGETPIAKRLNERSTDLPNDLKSDPETTTSKPSGRYTRRKLDPKAFRKFDPIPKTPGEPETSVPAKREFRPRTATYRRHSEAPAPVGLLNPLRSLEPISIAITPKSPKFHSTFKSAASLPSTNAKNVNVRISENSSNGDNNTASLTIDGVNPGSGIFESSNGETGNGGTNVFNPTRTLFLINRNTSLLEQLRSTVAPLLSSLGMRSPVFAGSYRNTTSTGNSAIRVTPSGQPPRFSARYKGAELFVRRPNTYQPTVPSLVSSTTPLTPLKVFGVSSPLDVSSPGEPQVLTYYQALETASINNEQQTDVQQPASVGQVDNDNDKDKDINDTNNANIDNNTVPVFVPRLGETETSSNTSENTITTEPETTKNPVANFDSSETTTNTAQDASPESTPNSQTTAEAVTEFVQTMTTSSEPNEATSQFFDISSTTLATDANPISTSLPDTSVAPDVEETSSPQNTDPFAKLLETTTVSLASTSSSLETFESTTNVAPTEMQESSSESSQEITTPGSTDSLPMSTVTLDIQTTQIPETTSMPFLQIQMQIDADANTPSAESSIVDAGTTPGSLTVDSTTGSESTETTVTTTPVVDAPQTTPPSILARFSDSETPDVTTVTSSTQEPTTPSSLEITALFGVATDVSQVTNQLDTEVPTQITPTNSRTEFSELEIGTDTSTQSLGQSDTTTPTPATTQNVRERLEQETEGIGGGTISDISSSTISVDSALLSESTTISQEIFATNPESRDSLLSTTAEPRLEQTDSTTESLPPSTTISFENRFGTIPSDAVSVTMEPSIASIIENLETVTTVVPETTTVITGDEASENTSSQVTTEMDSVNSSQLLTELIDNTATTQISAQEIVTQTTQNILSFETTTPLESLSDTTTELESVSTTTQNNSGVTIDSFDISARLVEIETTQDPTLTTNTILTPEIIPESDGAFSQTTRPTEENGITELTTNLSTVNEVTTDSMPETSTNPEPTPNPNLITDTPTLLARLQDVTATTTATVTAQGTAGLDVQATTRPNETSEIPETTSPSSITQSPTTTPTSQVSQDEVSTSDTSIPEITTTTISPDSNEPTTASPQMIADLMATTEEIPATSTAFVSDTQTPTSSTAAPETSLAPIMAATTVAAAETTFGIDENLISADAETTSVSNDVVTEAVATTTDDMQRLNEIDQPTTILSAETTTTEANRVATTSSTETTTLASTTLPPPVTTTVAQSSTTAQVSSTVEAAVVSDSTIPQTQANTPQPRENLNPSTPVSFPGRFGGNRLTPAPRFSSSSSTQTPLRDYHVYGIYPNKTIVRKRPEDNLIDGRNVNSPYVIFGIYPDGKLVRKFPNGTVIPDPPSNPVEVVFSLSTSTTTTNRPGPVFYNQANPGYYNQITPNYNNRPVPSIFNQNTNRFDASNFGFTGNTITGSSGGDSGLSSVGIANKKMSDVLLETQMGTNSNTASEISDLLTVSPNVNTGGATPTPSSGGRITQDREFDRASTSRESNGQRSSVYIGQEKFINYWSDSTPNTSPRVVSVRINSVASSSNVGPASAVGSSLPSFDILPGSRTRNPSTASPGFPWSDPLDQIFGITTNSPVVTASVATNTLPDNLGRTTILPRPINPFVEVFTPVSSSIDTTVTGSTSSTLAPLMFTEPPTTTTTTTTTTPEPTTTTTSTTTPAPTTTTSTTTTTTPAPTTTTTTPAPTTTTTTTTTTTPAPTTTAASLLPSLDNPTRLPLGIPQEAPFGNTFNDLAFLNALLQPANSGSSTQKTLSQAEQYLADKIISLALGNVGPTRSPKAIQPSNNSPNSFDLSIDSESRPKPIIINLSPSTTTKKPSPTPATTQFTWKPVPIVRTTPKSATTTQRSTQATWKPIPVVQTTRKEVTIPVTTQKPFETTQKLVSSPKPTSPPTTTPRPQPRPTTAPPNQGFAAGLLTALFGSNPFAPAATPAPAAAKKPAVTTEKFIETRRPVSTTQKPVQQTTAKLLVAKDPLRIDDLKIVATTEKPVTNGITVLLNNPNPRVPTLPSSTFSPEEDAKFLTALLNSASRTESGSPQKPASKISAVDEAFLKALLNNADPKVPTVQSSTYSPEGEAKILAALLNSASQAGSGIAQKSAPKTSAADEALLKAILNNANPKASAIPSSTFSPEDDAKFLAALLNSASQPGNGASGKPTPGVSADDQAFLRAILSGQANVEPASSVAAGTSGGNDAALLAALLKAQGIGPSTPANNLRKQLGSTTTRRPVTTTWAPSSSYPPSIFDAFSNFGNQENPRDDRMIAGSGDDTVRSQVVGAAIGATKAFSRFLGQAITGAAQQIQSFVKNGSKYVSEAYNG